MNIGLKEVINKIEDGEPLVVDDLVLLKNLGEQVEYDILDVNENGYCTYRLITKVDNRYFSIVYESFLRDGRFEVTSIYDPIEVKPVEKQVTITEYVSIYRAFKEVILDMF